MKKIEKICIAITIIIFSISNLSAAITAEEYKVIIGRGMATSWFKSEPNRNDYSIQHLRDLKARGFHNIRIRTAADIYDTSTELDMLANTIDDCIAEGIVPIISWVNHSAEERANNTDKTNYINWWSQVALKLHGKSDLIAFNLFTELNNDSPLKHDPEKYNDWTLSVYNAIRAISPTRMIILASPGKESDYLQYIDTEPYENDDCVMAEWHSYASGPNKNGGTKNWVGDGSEEDRQNVYDLINWALDFTASSGIPTYVGAWMPMDASDGDLNQTEVENFARFFLTELSNAGMPWSANALTHYYDEDEEVWLVTKEVGGRLLYMEPIVDIFVTVGDFGGEIPQGEAPAAPTNLNATVVSCSEVDLTWTDNADNEDQFKVKHSTDGGVTYTLVEALPANTESYSVTGLAENTTYDFMVVVLNDYGIERVTVTENTGDCYIPVYYTLTTSVTGSGSISPAGGTYLEGTSITLTATADENWTFDSWSGDASGTSEQITIIMDSDKNVSATFTEDVIGDITVTLDPTDDAYVKSTVPNTNFGSSDYLKVNADNKQAFMKFDLSTIGTVTTAELQVTSNGPGTVQLWKVTDDAWDEMSITWNTKLENNVLLGTYEFTSASTQSLDVTYYINAHAEKDDAASFGLVEVNSVNVILDSKEGVNGPKLVVTHDAIPKINTGLIANEVSLFPNPTSGAVNLQINDVDFNYGIVNIYSPDGTLIETVPVENPNSVIELKGESGLYFIKTIYNDVVQTTSILKK